MNAAQVAAISYLAGAVAFGLFTLLLLTAWRGRLLGGMLVAASGITTLWCLTVASFSLLGTPPFSATLLVELLRTGAWLVFLLLVLGHGRGDAETLRRLRLVGAAVVGLCIVTAGVTLASREELTMGALEISGPITPTLGHVLLAVAGLVTVEQIYRNTRREHRWELKFLCFGIGGLFAYDLYLYAHSLLFKALDANLWIARGAIGAMVVPFLAVSARRSSDWSVDIFVSRHVVFHSAALFGAGLYLLLMAAAGYYIRAFGGSWGAIAQAVFLFGAVMLLAALMASGRIRSEAKVFLSKHFYRNQYDYREEWLRFTRMLSTVESGSDTRETIVRAIATIVQSPGGVLWQRGADGRLAPTASWSATLPEEAMLEPDASLATFMTRTGWVVYLDEYRAAPESYPDLELPAWVQGLPRLWVMVPLMHGDTLAGFVGLNESPTKRTLNWEDSDLLKTVGSQAASYVALLSATEALSEARQFEAFNRLSAYVVHDLKNLMAQLSLVVSNARRHMHSPGFVEDAIDTVDNATGKMNRMLAQLRKGRMEVGDSRNTSLRGAIEEAVAARQGDAPRPEAEIAQDLPAVRADPDRMTAVIEHLVQNAQDATPAGGSVVVRGRREQDEAVIEVTDTGCGMDAQFIRERLFRPFDTTKGNAGMGVGVYESREFVQASGGRMEVESTPGAGTTIRLRLPGAFDDVMTNDNVEMAS